MSERTELHDAASRGDLVKFSKLPLTCREINIADESGWTPLMIASSAGHKEIVEILIRNGADVCLTNNNGQAALHYAASKNHLAICKLLLVSGADVNVSDKYGSTPLHRAAPKGLSAVTHLLCQQDGADLNIQDCDKKTPLQLSFEERQWDICRILLSYGAIVPEMTEEGKKLWNEVISDCPVDS